MSDKIGSGAIELERIVEIDPAARRIDGVEIWGVDYRLRLSERDLAVVARLPGR